MDINKEKLISNIDNLADMKGISRTQALIESGVGKDFVSNMIRKNTDPSVSKVMKIAEYFNVTIDYLLGKDENSNEKIVLDMNQKDMVILPRETKELSQEDYETLKKLLDGTVETFLKAKGKL